MIVIAAYGFTAIPLLVASLLAVGGAAALCCFLPGADRGPALTTALVLGRARALRR